ncbi:MAG: N-6 DNA methylase [Ignavibacteriaceae bacterium]|nr:N-6 DNA methylase [Ignavibacteriaceae bacterium]
MLDTQTKRRIDDCRDILVGKLPDPKAQIEQITIGLIYKFMDDMDKEAVELGGSAKFFSGDFEKYSWDNLINPKVTAAEMLALYSEAIVQMDKNPNIPQLFRDIFKNAYLPYRDPETLKLFLKTIGEFEYTHSEKLGDAFEYLLSVMGSQGDAGQFRTPRHIIDFLVAIIDPDKTETILDPACGTAGFLISAYKHILLKYSKDNKQGLNIYEYNKLEKKPFNNLGDLLTPDDRKKLIQNFVGYDISPDMVRLSLVNLYLHGFNTPNIHEYDTLSSEERWNESFDLVLANPPFMSPKGGIRPHKKFTISSNRSEVLFVDYIAEHLNYKGKAGIIVPEGIIFQSGTAYKDLRKMLVENHLYAVVSLPAGVFNPYSGVKTSILVMDKEVAKKQDEILFIKIDNDGYNLGAQRTAVKGGQLEEAIKLAHQFVETGELVESSIAHLVTKAEIAKNGDFNLSGERYRANDILTQTNFDTEELGEIVEILDNLRKPITKSDRTEGQYPYYGATGILDYVHDYIFDEKLVLVGEDGAKWLSGDKTAFIAEGKYWVNNHAHVLRPIRTKVLDLFLVEMLNYMDLSPFITGVTVPKLNQAKLRSIQIPLPPLSIQEEIVAEIDGYQKIIDGAKAVVDNYKPKIDIDPNWEMVELGQVCNITSSRRIFKDEYVDEGVPFYRTKEIVELSRGLIPSLELFISHERYTEIKENNDIPKPGDILVSAVATLGVSWIVNHNNPFYFKDGNLVWIKDIKEDVESIYLKLVLDIFIPNQIHILSAGAAYQALTIVKLKQLEIPIPDIETQRQIVAQIENEQALVNANKQLIEIFEQKIKDRIAKVWGE